jgi:hypothetical protein
MQMLRARYTALTLAAREDLYYRLHRIRSGAPVAWDIQSLIADNPRIDRITLRLPGQPSIVPNTASFGGGVYWCPEINYVLYGAINRLEFDDSQLANADPRITSWMGWFIGAIGAGLGGVGGLAGALVGNLFAMGDRVDDYTSLVGVTNTVWWYKRLRSYTDGYSVWGSISFAQAGWKGVYSGNFFGDIEDYDVRTADNLGGVRGTFQVFRNPVKYPNSLHWNVGKPWIGRPIIFFDA